MHLCALAQLIVVPGAAAAPVSQPLKRPSSSIKFGIEAPSPTMQMNGSFSNFTGALNLQPTDLTQSSVELSLNLQSAQLPPDQVLQAVFLQTALAQLRERNATFKSTSISRFKGNTYLVTGNYTWQGKVKEATVPVEVIRATPGLSEIRLLLNGSLKDKDVPKDLGRIAGNAGGSKGWVKANLVFAPR